MSRYLVYLLIDIEDGFMRKQMRVGLIVLVTFLISMMVRPFAAQDNTIDLRRLPLGDGNVSFDVPQVGYVFSCTSQFGGGGAAQEGAWMNGDGTYDRTAKTVFVDGEVMWASNFEITLDGDIRLVLGNGLPNHPTGVYPVATSDDAYNYDRNPNTIQAQDVSYELPANPEIAETATCVDFGTIGIMLTGSVFFNALDGPGRDAVAHEILDGCQGHPERTGEYHYHDLSLCIEPEVPESGHSALVGYALDGFGIFGRYGEEGAVMTNADLDECHGHTHEIEWGDATVTMYHYHATWEYPYTLGCYRGTPVAAESVGNAGGQQPGGTGGQPPAGQQPPPTGGQGGQQPPPTGGQGGQQPPPPGGG
jgi:hypothetical protein